VATKAAALLRGKHKPEYTPHVDCGDHVIVINCDKVVLTGNKLDQKVWYRHSGWVGGLKQVKYSTLMAQRPEKAMELAVNGMIPNNSIGRSAMTRLRVYAGSNHSHAAQKPETLEF
jgi:large subunit ribosomal protein L13